MTTVFNGTPEHQGIGGDYARVVAIDGRVRIRAIDRVIKEAATIAMTPEQARLFAAGIIEAADRAEGKQ